MASSAAVTLHGRFSPGTVVRLVEVRDESVLRSEGGKEVDRKKVDDDGRVRFTSGVKDGGYYLVSGLIDGFPREVRARGKKDADSDVGFQAPVQADRVRLSDGSWADEGPEQHQKAGFGGVGPAPGQHQVPKGQVQRSDTPRGTAHPHDPSELVPYPSQADVKKGTVQRSATEFGMATPIPHEAPASQKDVKRGTLQRSDTPLGYATPIPKGDAVEAQKQRESSEAKVGVGEPVKAAASPPDVQLPAKDRERDNTVVLQPDSPRVEPAPDGDTSGTDPLGQPLADDVADAAGVEPADKPDLKKNSKETK